MVWLGSLKVTIILEGVGAWYVSQYLNRLFGSISISWEMVCMMVWLGLGVCQLGLFIWHVKRSEKPTGS